MSEEPKKSWLRFWFKVSIYIVIFFAVILTTLSMLGGTGDTLKSGVEQFFTRASGYPARVETLNGLHFFPDFQLDLEGLVIEDSPDTKIQIARLDSLKVAMGFWDMFAHTGNIKAFDLRGLQVAPGFVHAEKVTVERLSLLHPQDMEPFLEGAGLLGSHKWSVRMDVESAGVAPYVLYRFGERRAFKAALADLAVEGALVNDGDDLVVEDFALKRRSQDFLAGTIVLGFPDESKALLSGDMTMEGKNFLKPQLDLIYSGDVLRASGEVQASATGVEESFERMRLDIQTASSYPAARDGKPMLLGIPVETDIRVIMGETP